MMMIAAVLAAASLMQASPQVPAQPQPAPPASSTDAAQDGAATTLEDVVVDGRPVAAVAQAFVEAVAATPRERGLARWFGSVCVGVVNVQPQVAEPLIDHISAVALSVGLRIGGPGCQPNIVIAFATDAADMATSVVDRNRRAFHLGVGGLDRGKVALEAFQRIDRPVRWWHVSMPVVGETGARAIRMPGDGDDTIYVPGEGRANNGRPITDSLNKVIVIVDVDQIQTANLAQLGDYLAMVTLAQVDLEGSTEGFDSILNLFEHPARTYGLTEWDQAYLDVLYDAHPQRVNRNTQSSDLARRVIRTRSEANASPE